MNRHASMNRAFRIVWSAARGQYIVASELAKGRSKGSSGTRAPLAALAVVTGLGFAGASGLAEAQVVPATTVLPTGGNTNAYISPNGVPVVNINTANGAGVSHNKYTRYDVEANGLVLNNGNMAESARQSKLAGQVMANINLAAEARVILNEVVSTRRSTLAGFTEVLGGKADVIVANPYGITCSGCGFINSDRVTLTTGTPNFGFDGSVAGFSVQRGDILINGGGLNASAQQILDLVTRSLKIDAQVNTKNDGSLGIVTGLNTWSYGTREVNGSTIGTDASPAYAIDSTVLGGIYAGRIRIIATEAGLGVRMLGDAAASVDDFTLSSAGKVEIRSKISAERDLALASTAAQADALNLIDANVSARRDVKLTATQGGATLSGGVVVASNDLSFGLGSLLDTATNASIADNNKRFAGNAFTQKVSGAATMNDVNYGAAASLSGEYGSLTVGPDGATLDGGTTLGLTTKTGNLDLGTASLRAQGNLDLTAQAGSINTASGAEQGIQSVAGNLGMKAATGLNNAGTITADAGSVTARIGNAITNTGTLHAATTLDIADANGGSSEDIDNSGTMLADGALVVKADDFTNSGSIQGTAGTTVAATSLTNTGSFIASDTAGGAATFTLSNAFNNSGTLQGKGALTANAGGAWTNSGDVLALSVADGGSAGATQISGSTISNSGTIDAAGTLLASAAGTNGTTFSNTGAIQATGAMTLHTGAAMNNSGKVVGDGNVAVTTASGNFTLSNSGQIEAGELLAIGDASHTASTLNNSAAGTLLGNQLDIKAGNLSNAGTIQATNGTTVAGSTFTNTGNFLVSTSDGADGSLSFTGAVDNQGTLQSAGGLTVSSASTITNSGTVLANGVADTLALTGTTVTNTGNVKAADALNVNATATSGTTVSNSGQMSAGGTLALASGGNIVNDSTGKLIANAALTISTMQSAINLANAGRIQSGGAMSIGGAGHLIALNNQQSGIVYSGSTLNLTGGNLDNQGKLTARSGTTMNVGTLTNGSASNHTAVILGATDSGGSSITANGALDNYGAIHSNDTLSLTAAGVTNRNTGGMSSLTTLNVNASGSGSINNYGALYAGNALNLNATGDGITNHAGTGTIDSNGTFSANSADFTNNNAIVANGNISITATNSFKNETVFNGTSITKTLGAVFNTRNWRENQIAEEASFDYGSNVWVVDEDYSRREQLVGMTEDELAALPKAHILATGGSSSVTINYGNSGLNKIAVLSAPTINISGTGTFTNEDMSLHQFEYTRRWIRVEDESSGDDDFVTWASISANRKSWDGNPNDCDGACNWDDWNPGSGWVRSAHVAAGGFPGHLQDWARDRSVDGAIRNSGVVEKRFGAGIFGGTLNFTGGALNNVSSMYPDNPNYAKVGSAQSGSISSKSATGANAGSAGNVTGTNATYAGGKSSVTPAGAVSFSGLVITLPTNPNGYFVMSQNPQAKFLVETNPMFNVGSNFVGSDYLSERLCSSPTEEKRLCFKPDTVQKRLGDANYEAHLIRQQLIDQVGSNILKGYEDEAKQMQRLMDQALVESAKLGLTFGAALSKEQIANLQQDMVWMVETEVNGQKVLAPVVYLAASTKAMIEGGAVIAGTNVNMDVASLNNTGGTIAGDSKLNIKSKGDITNLSGNIKGGDVSLVSTEGSIKNETYAQGAGDNSSYATEIGKTAGITATGNLELDAKKDITVKGADVKAAGDVSLAAGENVTFDTIVDKKAETTYRTSSGLLSSSTETTNTITTTNIGSNLGAGGNLTIKSGKDTTIAGSNVDVGGNMKVEAEGNFNVLSRQDTVQTSSTSTVSGLGVGGGLAGTSTTETDSFKGRNVASNIKVGGDADIKTANTMTVQGSNIDIGGNASIKADDVQILAGQDVDRTTTKTTTTTFLKLEGPKGDTSAGAHAGARAGADSMAKGGNASAGAGASAEAGAGASASGSVGLSLAETTTTNTFDLSQRSVGSTLNIGGNLKVDSNKSITLQGANVEVGGDADLKAKDIKVLAAQDVNISTSKTTTTSIGLYVDSTNSAQAGASAGAGASAYANSSADANGLGGSAGAGAQAQAGAQANASASSDTNIDIMRTKTTESESLNITNTGSVLKVGGKLNATAENKLTVQGSDISGEQGVTVKAKDMEFLAAEDVSYSKTSTTTVSAGLYLTGNASADAGAKASVQADAAAQGGLRGGLNQDSAQASLSGSASAEAGAGASAKIGAGVQTRTNSTTTTEGSTTARVSTIRSGSGSIERTAENRILDVGTGIEAAGDFTQSATTIDSVAARNTSFSTTESESHTARVGVYLQGNAEARASASAEGNAGVGYLGGNTVGMDTKTSAEAGANASVGIEAEYTMDKSKSSSSSSQAVASTIKAGGKVSSTSSGKTTLEGTQIEGGTGVELAAKDIDFKAARDTETSSESGLNVNARANLGLNLGSDGVVEGGLGGGFGKEGSTASSSTAVVGGIKSGGNLTIKTQGDARFEGTTIDAAGDASVAAGGNLQFDAARNTSSSTSNSSNAEASVSISKSGGGGKDESSKGIGVAAAGGFSNEKSSSSEAVVASINTGGNLTLSAGKNATFEGTAISAGGDTDVAAGGNVSFNEARNTSSSESTSFSASVELGKSNSSNAKTGAAESSSSASFGAEGSHSREKSSEAVTGSLETGGNLRIRSGGDTTFVGTDLAAGGSAAVQAGGNVNFKAAESTSESFNVGGSVGMAGSTTNTTPGKAEAPSAGAGAAAAAAGVAKPAGGAGAASEPEGPSTERERSGSFGIEAGYSTETERKGGSIKSGSGLQISAGKDANFEGTKVSAGGDASVSAGGDVNITTARSTSSSIGGSIGMEAEKKTNTGDPTQDSSSKGGSIGIEGGKSTTHEGASLESGGKLTIASGGKTTMVNTETKAEDGTVVAAAGGVSRSRVSDSDFTVKMSAAGTSESEPKAAPAAAPAPAAGAAQAAAGVAKPAEAKAEGAKAEEGKAETAKPETPKTAAEKKEAAKKEAAKKEAAKKEAEKKAAAAKTTASGSAPAVVKPAAATPVKSAP